MTQFSSIYYYFNYLYKEVHFTGNHMTIITPNFFTSSILAAAL